VIDRGIKLKVIREKGELSIPWKVEGCKEDEWKNPNVFLWRRIL
jgi:hypothetical protein